MGKLWPIGAADAVPNARVLLLPAKGVPTVWVALPTVNGAALRIDTVSVAGVPTEREVRYDVPPRKQIEAGVEHAPVDVERLLAKTRGREGVGE